MIKVGMDFETYSEANLKNVGAHRYAMDKSTDVLCLSYRIGDNPIKTYKAGGPAPIDLFNAIKDGALVYAWNTTFEYSIWKYVCIPKLGWPEVPFNQWRDSQAIASLFAWPLSLEKCGEAMGLAIQKDKRGKYLIDKLSKPQKLTKKNPYKRFTPETHPELFQEMYAYCERDVESEGAILSEFPWEITGEELTIWRNTLIKNNIGIPIDVELVESVVAVVDDYLEEVSEMVPILTGGAVRTINQRAKILEWCELQGYELPDFTAGTIEKVLEDPELEKYPQIKNLLNIRTLAGKSSVKKFKKILEAVCDDGRIRDCLKYHKATTGREGGRLLQPQNLPRATVPDTEHAIKAFKTKDMSVVLEDYDNLVYSASALIRPSICATEGNHFVVSDYSSVENRIVSWLAGQTDILEKMDNGLCLYTDMASSLYGVKYEDIPKDSEMRRHGKLAILGCGFGLGHKKFLEDCIGRGFDISLEEAKRTINIFREKYKQVVEFWYGLKDAAEQATQERGEITSYNSIQFMHHMGYLFMILPNGKTLAYPEARLEEMKVPWGYTVGVVHSGINPRTKKWGRVGISPGRYAENATQATAREILMEAQNDVIAQGHNVVLTVHDELVVETPEVNGLTIDGLNKIMENRSSIYRGLPLKAAGFESKRYHK